MHDRCSHCNESFFSGHTFCVECGSVLRDKSSDRIKKQPKTSRVSKPEPEKEQKIPGIHIQRGKVGVSGRKVTISGANNVSDNTGNIGYDDDVISIKSGVPGNEMNVPNDLKSLSRQGTETGHPAVSGINNTADAQHISPGGSISVSKGNVGHDDSVMNIFQTVNNITVIDPKYSSATRPWECRADPAQARRRTRHVYVATRESVLEFSPDDNGMSLLNTGRYKFREPVRAVRSLTPLDIAGEIVLMVGTRERVGIWQPLAGNRSEMGFYRCVSGTQSKKGFNSATALNGYIYSTHSEKGLIRWKMSEPDMFDRINPGSPPHAKRRHGDTVRCIRAMADNTFFVIQNRSILNLLIGETAHVIAEYTAPDIHVRRCIYLDKQSKKYGHCDCRQCLGNCIASLCAYVILENHIFAISENGLLIRWERNDPASGRVIRNFGHHCFTMDVTRHTDTIYLIIGCGYGVHLIPVISGEPEWFYPYHSGKINVAYAGADMVIAAADDMSKLLVWRTDRPGELPSHEILLKRQFGNRGQSISVLRE
jgi:hypothetical protein